MADRLAFIDDRRLVGLLARSAEGDRHAFRQLYELTAPRLLALLRQMLGQDRAEDVLQDAYVKIWTRAGEYRKGRGSPLGWMTAIARNRAIDVIRKEGRSVTLDDPELVPGRSEDASGREENRWDHGLLHRCLEVLSREQQRCLRLAYFGGATHAEVAEKVASPLGTVKSWIRRGLDELKRCLDS